MVMTSLKSIVVPECQFICQVIKWQSSCEQTKHHQFNNKIKMNIYKWLFDQKA
jgi:hypothetical protein